MSFVLTEEQVLLKDQVRALLEEQASPETLRELINNKQPWSQPLWQTMAELGLQAAAIPEAYGGVGLGLADLCLISEELGRAVAPVPYSSSILMAAEAIRLAGDASQQERWLPGLASGEQVATFAWAEGRGAPFAEPLTTIVENDKIRGTKSPVADSSIANLCVVLVSNNGEPALAVVDLDQPAVTRSALQGFDELRHHARINFNGASCEVLAERTGTVFLREFFERIALIQAFEQLGGTQAALYMARDYSMDRYIFGRQLASYQAVKHKLADILVMEELAHANALGAIDLIDSADAQRHAGAASARLGATAAYEKIATENLQIHGGIGFTWEANCHFHYRRARLLALNLGSTECWTNWLIDELASTHLTA